MREHYFMKPYWIKTKDWAGDMYRADEVDKKIAQLNEHILHLESLIPNINSEITELLRGMFFPDIKEMFFRYIQEGEKLKGDFSKAEEFIVKLESMIEIIFKNDNEHDSLADWKKEINEYRKILERYKKIWTNHKEANYD